MSESPIKISQAPAGTSAWHTESGAAAKNVKVRRRGLISEYIYFLKTYKMWWLLPVMAMFLILGFLVILGGSKAALLLYALF